MASRILSKLANTLIGSEIVKLGGIIKEKIKQGDQVYNYTIGDFDSGQFPIPKALEEEIISAYRQGFTTYPAADGELVLRLAVSQFIASHEGLDFTTSEVLIAAGGRPLIYAAYRALVDEGDKVIYPVPSWNNNHYVHFTGGKHIVIEAQKENNFLPTAAQIAPHVQGATLIALCSPLNPTGTTFSAEALSAICDLVLEENNRRSPEARKLFLLYDQIYWTLTFGDVQHHSPVSLRPAMKDFTIYIDGISKAFASTGVRVGWALGPADVLAKMRAINSHIGSWAPMAEQHAVAHFLKNDQAIATYFEHFKMEINYRLTKIYDGFSQLKKDGFPVDAIAPQAAIYLTIQLNLVGKKRDDGLLLNTQEEVTEYILNEAKIAIVPFQYFGADKSSNWYRLSVGVCKKEEIEGMLQKLRKALEKLN